MQKDARPTPDPGKPQESLQVPLPGQDAKAENGGSSGGERARPPTRYELLREDWIEVQSL